MIEITKIYFFETVDKTPFVYVNDPAIFISVLVNSANPSLVDSMEIDESALNLFEDCARAYLDFDVNLDFEQHLPDSGAIPYQSNCIYNYRLLLVRENDTKQYDIEFNRFISFLGSKVWQILYQTIEGEWFICYAELGIINTTVQNDIVQNINFEALNSKEEIYNIDSLTLS
jgi:hypothetical protein